MARYRLPIIAAFVALMGVAALTTTASAYNCTSTYWGGAWHTSCY